VEEAGRQIWKQKEGEVRRMGDEIRGRDWLLLLIAAGSPGAQVDPVRIMKGAFLLTEELAAHNKPRPYQFIAYHYGPCAFEVYSDLDSLAADGLIAADANPWRRWPVYRPTAAGIKHAAALAKQLGEVWAGYIRELRAWLNRQTFESLLRFIYTKHPDYASATLLPDLGKQA
jgi:hypothetical protein